MLTWTYLRFELYCGAESIPGLIPVPFWHVFTFAYSLPRYASQIRITATISCKFSSIILVLACYKLASELKALPRYDLHLLPNMDKIAILQGETVRVKKCCSD